jgi:hypothetical protein
MSGRIIHRNFKKIKNFNLDKPTLRRMKKQTEMKLLTILAILLASAAPAMAQTAYWSQKWDCGKNVTVTLNKYSTAGYEISITGALIVNPRHSATYNFKLIHRGSTLPLGASLNGRSCRALPKQKRK